jgi:hypothetical protein
MTSVLPPLKEEINPPAMPSAEPESKREKSFPLSTWGGVQTMVTSYSMDYCKKDGTPSEKRPCSATRRNRPHPSKVIKLSANLRTVSDVELFMCRTG